MKDNWKEFRDSGLLWWINMILHTFGWAIVVDIKDKGFEGYVKRVKYRGFAEDINTNGYIKVSNYLLDNAEDLLKESKDW
jgi:hypothetical protein